MFNKSSQVSQTLKYIDTIFQTTCRGAQMWKWVMIVIIVVACDEPPCGCQHVMAPDPTHRRSYPISRQSWYPKGGYRIFWKNDKGEEKSKFTFFHYDKDYVEVDEED